ncbi:MAG: hypothetical protein JWM75_1940 [Sphingomonas bacterium]|nr:hypothetical protein [Sphingomonas bacterium]
MAVATTTYTAEPAAPAARTIDVQRVVDDQSIGRIHIVLLILCTLIMFIDGFDIFMVGKLAPSIAEDFGQPASSLTLLFLLQQIGLTLGAFTIGPISDRFGRKRVLIWCALAFGGLTLASLVAQSVLQLAILRGIAGIFLSGVIPNATALLSELAPRGRRSSFISIAFGGYTAGGAAGAAVAVWLLEDYGWQSGFWIGGLLPLLFVLLFAIFGQESMQYRARRNAADPRIGDTLRKLKPDIDLSGVTGFVVGAEGSGTKARLLDVFSEGRAPMTLLYWGCYFLSLGIVTLLASWMASFFKQMAGVPVPVFALYSLFSFAGGMAGVLTIGFAMDRFGAMRVMKLYYLLDAVSLVAMGLLPFGTVGFTIAILAWAFFQAGAQGGLNALVAQAYPPRMRSTGVGWAFGAGRFGGIVSPVLGGMALAQALTLAQVFTLIGIAPLVIIGMLVLLQRVAPEQGAL